MTMSVLQRLSALERCTSISVPVRTLFWRSTLARTAIEENPVTVRDKVKVGVIGLGRIGQFHAQTVAGSHIATLGWVLEPNPMNASMKHQSIHTASLLPQQLDKALKSSPTDPDFVDAVIICSPTQFHPHYVQQCLERGKPVLCEKPLTSDPNQLLKFFKTARNQGVALQIGYQRVFDKDIAQLIKEATGHSNERKQPPLSISMRSYDSPTASAEYLRSCGSVFMDAMSHDFHVAASLLFPGDKLESAVVLSAPFEESDLGARTAVALFRTKANTFISVEFHRVSQIVAQRIESLGSEQYKHYRLKSRPRFALSSGDGSGILAHSDYDSSFLTKYADAYSVEIDAFLNHVMHNAPTSDMHEHTCVTALWMVKLANEATRLRREVYLSDYERM